jgi:phosphate transport system substrate-binding protein
MRAWLALTLLLTTTPAAAQEIVVKGSDTVGGELGPALAKGFEALHPGAHVRWEALGSKTAFGGLFDGSAALGASSRPITPAELADATRLGIKLQELIIAYDGLSIIVHPSNPLSSLTMAQLADLYSGKIESWKQLGGADEPVLLLARPPYSGTRTFFEEKALSVGGKRALASAARQYEHNQEIVAEVARTAGAVGFVGVASVTAAVKALPLAIAAGTAPHKPDAASVRDGSYPLYRPLYLYLRAGVGGLPAELARFILSSAGQDIVQAIGFVRLERSGPLPSLGETAVAPTPARPPVRVFFVSGGSQLTRSSKTALDRLVRSIAPRGERILVVGNADGRGVAAHNEALARARAGLVADYLNALGLDKSRLEIEGVGAAAPIATNETRAGRERNRRVDVYVIRADGHDLAGR